MQKVQGLVGHHVIPAGLNQEAEGSLEVIAIEDRLTPAGDFGSYTLLWIDYRSHLPARHLRRPWLPVHSNI